MLRQRDRKKKKESTECRTQHRKELTISYGYKVLPLSKAFQGLSPQEKPKPLLCVY